MNKTLTPRELAYCGLFGAAALLLPVIFHLVNLGHVFMPMYLPLVALGFFVSPLPAAITGFLVPLLSGAVTGMPPFFPPVAIFMSLELAMMASLISYGKKLRPQINEWVVLVPVLLFGRIFYVLLVYLFSLVINLPAKFMAGLSLISGWPGIILMIVVIPPIARIGKTLGNSSSNLNSGCAVKDYPKANFFDAIADKWDGWENLPVLFQKLETGLEELQVKQNETIVDIGCGTGNFTQALLKKLSPSGRVIAVDISPKMIAAAKSKVNDTRVEWHVTAANCLPLSTASCDRIFCYSVWPHFDNPDKVVAELKRVPPAWWFSSCLASSIAG